MSAYSGLDILLEVENCLKQIWNPGLKERRNKHVYAFRINPSSETMNTIEQLLWLTSCNQVKTDPVDNLSLSFFVLFWPVYEWLVTITTQFNL